jgi:opacity protein-like surface antigen
MGERTTAALLGLAALCATSALAADDAPERAVHDTGRFYLFVDNGHAFHLQDDFVGDAELDAPGGFDHALGGGGGYNLTERWSVEFQAYGIEPDIRSPSLGKVKELSLITLAPAVRYRWPLLDGRLMPWVSLGFGWSMSDVNDTGNLRIKLEMDEQTWFGSLGAGVDWFLADDVALVLSGRYFGHPKQDTVLRVLGPGNRELLHEESSADMSHTALLLGLRLFPGQPAGPGQPRRLLFADRGPFDTANPRGYVWVHAGHTFILDDDVGRGIRARAPGDYNATLGGGLGANLTRHWGVEVQLVHTEPNLEAGERGGGKIAELSNLTVLPAVRYRHPLRGGRIVPFGFAGLGASFNNPNDSRTTADAFFGRRIGFRDIRTAKVRIDDTTIAGVIGVGVEYFLNHHLSVGLSLPVYLYGDADTEVIDRSGRRPTVHDSFDFSGIALLFHVKAHVP